MNKTDVENLVEIRVSEARTLRESEKYEEEYYLFGYAVECAIKACIALFPLTILVLRIL